MTQKKTCFMCKRRFFTDDPEFDSVREIYADCADELERDNPYNVIGYENDDERKETV